MKTIVWDSPLLLEGVAVEIGVTFQRGVPQVLSDEAAEILLRKDHNGNQLNKDFKEVTDSEVQVPGGLKFDKPQAPPNQPQKEGGAN